MVITLFTGLKNGWKKINSKLINTKIIPPQLFLDAYSHGIFPMAENKHQEKVFWCRPENRGIIPIGALHISRSLKKKIKKGNYKCSLNKEFSFIINCCSDRKESWLNTTLIDSYKKLNNLGFCHSIEIWKDKIIVGGLFGVAIGGCFFAESMFSHQNDGSKIALVALMARLVKGEFKLLDTQFSSPHLNSMGGKEIKKKDYEDCLSKSILKKSKFLKLDQNNDWEYYMHLASIKSNFL